jgi:acetyltransferase-like isoleucine patch superfamily enzyme
MMRELIARLRFFYTADRIGPDIPLTHFLLHFKYTGEKLCRSKFRSFGEGADFRPGAYAEACSKISIGKNVVIRPGSFLFADPRLNGGEILIEDNVLIGPGVHFYVNNHEFSDSSKPIIGQGYPSANPKDGIVVRNGSWIGAGAILLPGVEIGANSVIGAGSVVTRSIPHKTLAVGNPCRIVRHL